MLVSSKGRYALRMMIDIAQFGSSGPVPLKEIARRQNLPMKYIEQLVRVLTRAELLRSVRGQHGGYVLNKEPSDMTAGDILRVVEGSTAPVACLTEDAQECPHKAACVTVDFWEGLDAAIAQYVDGVTLADLSAPKIVLADVPAADAKGGQRKCIH